MRPFPTQLSVMEVRLQVGVAKSAPPVPAQRSPRSHPGLLSLLWRSQLPASLIPSPATIPMSSVCTAPSVCTVPPCSLLLGAECPSGSVSALGTCWLPCSLSRCPCWQVSLGHLLLEPGHRAVKQRRDQLERPWWPAGQHHSWDPGEPRTPPRWSMRVPFLVWPSGRVTAVAEPSQPRPRLRGAETRKPCCVHTAGGGGGLCLTRASEGLLAVGHWSGSCGDGTVSHKLEA